MKHVGSSGVTIMMKHLAFALVAALAACGPKQTTPLSNNTGSGAGSSTDVGNFKDTRTEIEKRRDAACEQLQPVLTECAITDAKSSLSKEEYAKLKPEELRSAHKKKFLEECEVEMSSRQVRVLEVCFREEKECGPLSECLANLQPQSK